MGYASANAQTIDNPSGPPGLDTLVDEASRIAVVRIADHRRLYDPSDFGYSRCGYLLDAEVVEALKGDSRKFTFFAPGSDFNGSGKTYFVMVFKTGDLPPTALMPPIDRHRHDRVAEQRCQALRQFYTPIQIQTLWSFDSSGKWLSGANRIDGLLCGFERGLARRFHIRSVTGIRIRLGAHGYSINWDDARSTILRRISNPGSPIGCGMDDGVH
jgi:hypothetical protein